MNVNEQTPTPASPWDWLATLCFGPDGVQSDQLRQGTALFQSLVDSLPLNLMIKDRDGRRVFANRGYLELHQVEFDDVRGKSDFDLFPEKIARRFREEDVRVLEQGITLQGVEEQPMRDEQSRWIERIKGPLRGADGEIRGVQVLFWDVTGRRQTEQALDLERGLLHSLMDNIPDAIYFKDRESRFIRVSRAMQDKHGLADPDEVVGQTDEDLFTEEHAQQALADEREIMRTGEPLVARLERETWPHRNDTWVSTTKMPLRNSDGATVGTFGISRDVTELKQAQDQLLHARDAANAASKAKSDFLANVSHEIRTPMNGIIGMTELLLNTELSDEQHEYQSIVKSSAHALLSLLNSILDFSKIESGKLELEIVPFELRETIGNTLQTLAARAAQKGLELAVRIPPEAPERLLGDPSRLRQILVNLVGNAIKFTDRGEVVVEVAVDSIDRHMSDLHFTVRDTGPGVPPEKQARIFEAFSQADASTTRKYGGTGLGLAISTQLVQLMGGRIWVESELGQGSTFHFVARLPLAPGKGPTTTGDFETLHGVPVLVVDDSQTNRLICQELLSVWGMNPTAVEGGQAAVALLRKTQATANPFRLVLLDVMMPGMDGFDVAKRMREDQGLADVAIIMLSSAGRPGDAAQARDLGVARCMTKPVTQSEVLHAIPPTLGAALGDVAPSTSLTESR
ncbi:MAG: PAS domain-containing protein, partial [Planctomycetota bacterium]